MPTLAQTVANLFFGIAYGNQIPHQRLVAVDDAVETFKATGIQPEVLVHAHRIYLARLGKSLPGPAPSNVKPETLARNLDGVRGEALQACLKERFEAWRAEHLELRIDGVWLLYLERQKSKLPKWLRATAHDGIKTLRGRMKDDYVEEVDAMIRTMDAQMELPYK